MHYPSYVSSKHTPAIAADELTLRVRAGTQDPPVVFPPKGPWPLFGVFRVGSDTVQEFGVDPMPHLLIAVVHKESYGTYSGSVRRQDQARVPELGSFDERSATATGAFAIDLIATCGVRPLPGKYWVVVFLGKLASNVVEFNVE